MAIARARLFTAISGKVGSVEFAQRGLTTIIRNAKKPKTKVTWRTIEAQRLHAYKIYLWKYYQTIYPDFLPEWQKYAATHSVKNRFGQTHTLSAFQFYMKLFAPTQPLNALQEWPPTHFPQTPPPTTFSATITTPSALIVTAYFIPSPPAKITQVLYYSDPITPSTNYDRLRYHHLINTIQPILPPYSTDLTSLCTARNITWSPGTQIIIATVGIDPQHPKSIKSFYTVTAAAP
jgi:hypothetical protein